MARVGDIGERLDRRPVLEFDRQPRLGVGIGDELPLPEVGERRRRSLGRDLVGDPDTAPGAVAAV